MFPHFSHRLRPAACILSIFVGTAAVTPAATPISAGVTASATKARINANYAKLPMQFEANHGQTDSQVRFLSRGKGYALFFTDTSAVLSLSRPKLTGKSSKRGPSDVLHMELTGKAQQAHVAGEDQLPGIANYFLGNDPTQWRSNVPNYARVKYAAVYPGIDLVYYGNQRQLEYDFIVAPGADSHSIRLHFAGAKKLALTGDGDLEVTASKGKIGFQKPVIYQLQNGQRQPIAGKFALLANHTVGFTIPSYDHTRPLIIDPTLTYSTYLGGSNTDDAYAIAVDASGNSYITGSTWSTDFPITSGAYDKVNNGGGNTGTVAFVSKLNPAGTALIYSTFIGPGGGTTASAIAIDSAGDAYITGSVPEAGFPVTPGAFQSTYKAGNSSPGGNAFVTELNPTGSALVYSTYLGGSTVDAGTGIAVDGSGNAYISGYSASADFPTTSGAFQPKSEGSSPYGYLSTNAFITKMNPKGTGLVYSTYLGGSGNGNVPATGDSANAITVDSEGNAYVTGLAASSNFPVTKGAYQIVNKDGSAGQNAFVTKLNPTGSALVFSTYIGGTGGDQGFGIAQDASGVYIAGQTFSEDYPVTKGAFQPANNAAGNVNANAFVTKLNPTGTALIYSTYLGGSGPNGIGDFANAIAIDTSGDAYVTGETISEDFPITKNAFQSVNNDAANLGTNVFLTKLNPTGTALLYSSYLGGDGDRGGNGQNDIGFGVAVDPSGNAYIAGQAYSTDFPVTSAAFQKTNKTLTSGGGYETTGFVASFAIGSTTTTTETSTTLASSANPETVGTSVTFTAAVTPSAGTMTPTGNVAFSIDGKVAATVALTSGKAAYATATLAVGPHTVLATYAGSSAFDSSVSSTLTETIAEPVTSAPIFSPAAGTYNAAQSVTLTDPTSSATIYYTTNGTTPTTASTKYTAAIAIATTETIKAIAVAASHTNSIVSSATYTIDVAKPAATPTFSIAAGTYTAAQSVKLADITAGAVIYYTLNGTAPTTGSTKYTAAITVSASETIKAIAVATGYTNSTIASAAYVIETPTATPTFSVAAGTYATNQTVTLADATTGATIYYTLNGTTPTTASTKYTAAITVSASETIKAIAVATGHTNSAIASAAYVIETPAATPTFSIAAGTYTAAQSVKLADITAGAVIYYTLNGTTPTTASTKYTAAITVSASETIKAIAVATGHTNSAIASAAYVIETPAATPTFSVAAGTYAAKQSVTLSDKTASATIYYTTNGTTPTTASTKYTAAISVAATETIEAIAVAQGYTNSAVASAKYVIENPAATPIFSIPTGTYSTTQSVQIADATPGATIYYTTNGAPPTPASAVYKAAVSVSATEYLQAIAIADGYTMSAEASALYSIGSKVTATPILTPTPGAYAKSQTVTITDATPGAVITYSVGIGSVVSTYTYTGPFTVPSTEYIAYDAIAPGYTRSAALEGIYTIGTVPAPQFSPAAGIYSTAQVVNVYDITPSATIHYTTDGSTPTTASAIYTGPIIVPANQTIRAVAAASGLTTSPASSAAYTIGKVVATPTFSLTPGSYSSAQPLTIADITPGATIYYTLNGATPTTASTKYTAPITIAASETVKAIATASGDTNSAVASSAYTIGYPIATFVATTAGNSVLTLPVGGSAAFTVASENESGQSYPSITVKTTTGPNAKLPVQLSLCETNPSSGQCLAAPAATVTLAPFANQATPTFSVFVTATAAIASTPSNQIDVLFTNPSGTILGSATVTVVTN